MTTKKSDKRVLTITPRALETLVDLAKQCDLSGKDVAQLLTSVKNPGVAEALLRNRVRSAAFSVRLKAGRQKRFAKTFAAIRGDEQMTAIFLQIAERNH
jgi:hypothetical protein